MAKKSTPNIDPSDLVGIIHETINKNDKMKSYYLSNSSDNPANVKDWVSTGNEILDLIISNIPNGGLPFGRMVEIYGPNSSGKSLIAGHILAETQKRDGIGILFDTEFALHEQFMKSIGINPEKLLHIPSEFLEDVFSEIENIVSVVRKNNKDVLITIVVDSVMGAKTKNDDATGYELTGYNTYKARLISQSTRMLSSLLAKHKILLVFINQVRSNVGAFGHADKNITSGGQGIPFHSSVRIALGTLGKIKYKDEAVGVSVKATIKKNKIGPPFKSIEFDIFFNSGMDSSKSWVNAGKKANVLVKAKTKGYLKFSDDDSSDEITMFRESDIKNKLKDVEFKNKLYNLISNYYIMEYSDPNKVYNEDELNIVNEEDNEILLEEDED